MRLFRLVPFVLLMLGLCRTIGSDPVTLSIQQQTQPGQSIYVGGDHPLLGSGDVTKALKLSPHNYPQWQATVDFPEGLELEVVYLMRLDAPEQAGVGSNFTVLTTDTISTEGSHALQPITLYTTDEATTATLVILRPVQQTELERIEFETIAPGKLRVEVPLTHVNNGRVYRIETPAGNFPVNGVSRLQPAPVYWKFGQAFLFDPEKLESAPSPARIETFNFTPTGFPQRTVRVLLPRGYDASTAKYPVLYAEDGQNVFSPGGPFGSWDMDLIAKDLVARGDLPEFILVGIDNSGNGRIAEYTPEYATVSGTQGRGGEYLAALRDGLLPYINSHYRTRTGPENTLHIGSSLGGLLGFHAANEFEDTWGSVAAMSTSFWIGTEENLARAALPPAQFARLYIDSGNAGNSNDDYWNTYNVRDKLIESGHILGENFMHQVGIGDQHNEAAWRRRSPDVLRWLFVPHVRSLAPAAQHFSIR